MKNWLLITGSLLISTLLGTAHAAGDPEAGKAKAASCAACHGADGNSVNPEWPKLAGQHEAYLAKQLYYFQDGERENATMKGMVLNLSDQDMQDIAAFYASQKTTIGEADPELVENWASSSTVPATPRAASRRAWAAMAPTVPAIRRRFTRHCVASTPSTSRTSCTVLPRASVTTRTPAR